MNRGYLRVSTTGQDREEISLQAQREKIKTCLGNEAVVLYEDTEGGGSGNRKALQRMIKELEEGDKVLVLGLDRVSRSVVDIVELLRILEDKKATLVSCKEGFDSSSASGRAWIRMLNIFAEFEPKVCF